MAHDVFISYSSKDKPVADATCAILEGKDVRCWMAPRDILPGMEWSEAIIDAIHGSKIMVIIFSSHSDQSQQVRREAERAVNQGCIILPMRIEDVFPSGAMEYYLSTSHWLDALSDPMEKHLDHLAETVQFLLAGGTTDPAHSDAPNALPLSNRRPGEGVSGTTTAPAASGSAGAGTVAASVPASMQDEPIEVKGFNWGAFLLNRSWLGAHHVRLGCPAGPVIAAPYVGLLVGLVFGFDNKVVWLLGAGVLMWLVLGVRGNAWAQQNRRWINVGHFKKVQAAWLVRGLVFWAIVAALGAFFVKSHLNDKVAAMVAPPLNQVLKTPALQPLKPLLHQVQEATSNKTSGGKPAGKRSK